MYQCTNVAMYQCYIGTKVPRMYQCTDVPMYQCTNVPMQPCSNATLLQCANVPMYQCTNVPRYQGTKVPRYQGLMCGVVPLQVPRYEFRGKRGAVFGPNPTGFLRTRRPEVRRYKFSTRAGAKVPNGDVGTLGRPKVWICRHHGSQKVPCRHCCRGHRGGPLL